MRGESAQRRVVVVSARVGLCRFPSRTRVAEDGLASTHPRRAPFMYFHVKVHTPPIFSAVLHGGYL